jgi:hypothetical protein
MDARRSFYLASRQDDFAESAADLSPIDCADIPYVMPANDNADQRPFVGSLRDFAPSSSNLHGLNWPF